MPLKPLPRTTPALTLVEPMPSREAADAPCPSGAEIEQEIAELARRLARPEVVARTLARARRAEERGYEVIAISMYLRDLDKLDVMVAALKSRGILKANRSALIRIALDHLDLDKVSRGAF